MHARTQAEVVGIILPDSGCGDSKVTVIDVSPESLPIVIVWSAGLACGQPLLSRLSARIVGIEMKGPVEQIRWSGKFIIREVAQQKRVLFRHCQVLRCGRASGFEVRMKHRYEIVGIPQVAGLLMSQMLRA